MNQFKIILKMVLYNRLRFYYDLLYAYLSPVEIYGKCLDIDLYRPLDEFLHIFLPETD